MRVSGQQSAVFLLLSAAARPGLGSLIGGMVGGVAAGRPGLPERVEELCPRNTGGSRTLLSGEVIM